MARGDDLGPTPQIAMPRLTPAVKTMLIVAAALFVVTLLDFNWLPTRGAIAEKLVLIPEKVLRLPSQGGWGGGQVWRLFTWPWIEAGGDISGLFGGVLTLYFFGTALEDSFGTRRFILFVALCTLIPGLISLGYSFLHPMFGAATYGLSPLGYALTVVWGMRFPNQRLMFPPVSGKVLVWIAAGFLVIHVLALSQKESLAASIGAFALGLLFGKYWDRFDDLLDRFRIRRARAKRDKGLRAIRGGLDERGPKSKRPVDKRFLN